MKEIPGAAVEPGLWRLVGVLTVGSCVSIRRLFRRCRGHSCTHTLGVRGVPARCRGFWPQRR